MIVTQIQTPTPSVQQHSTTVINMGNGSSTPQVPLHQIVSEQHKSNTPHSNIQQTVTVQPPRRPGRHSGLMSAETFCMCQREAVIEDGSRPWSTAVLGCFDDLGSCKITPENS